MKNKIDTRTVTDSDYIILGQEPDNPDPGGFDTAQAFSGSLTQVSMWDKVLTAEEVEDLAIKECSNSTNKGNIINWEDHLNQSWKLYNVPLSQESDQSVCQPPQKTSHHSFIGNHKTVTVARAMDMCTNMGGQLPSELTESAFISGYHVIDQYYQEAVPSSCSKLHSFWTGLLIGIVLSFSILQEP